MNVSTLPIESPLSDARVPPRATETLIAELDKVNGGPRPRLRKARRLAGFTTTACQTVFARKSRSLIEPR